MIELHWYFWVIATLTLTFTASDIVKLVNALANKQSISVWVLPEIVGFLWCIHHVLDAVYS